MPTTQPATQPEPSISEHMAHSHGLDTISGYSIVMTVDGQRLEVARIFGATKYAIALAMRNEEQALARSEGRRTPVTIDMLYGCGCRSDRIDATTDYAASQRRNETLHA